MDDSSSEDFEAWISVGNFTSWLLGNALTRSGASIICSCAVIVSVLVAVEADNPWRGVVYLPFAVIGLGFLCLLAGLIGFTGDIFARWMIHKLFLAPSTKNKWHQCVYLVVSGVGFIMAAAFILPNFIGGDWSH